MLPPLAEIQHLAGGTARRTAALIAGGTLVLAGGAFLIVALWIVVEEAFDTLAAALVVAGVLLGFGLIIVGLAPRKPRMASAEERLRQKARTGDLYRPDGAMPPVVEAFLFGLAVSLQIKNRRR